MTKSNLNQQSWEKLVDALEQGSLDPGAAAGQEESIMKELHFIKSSVIDFVDTPIDSEAELKIIADRLNFNKKPAQVRFTPYWVRAVAAVISFVILLGGLSYYHAKISDKTQPGATDQYASGITPGKYGATLTLANGKKIKLTEVQNGELAKEAGVIITKSASGELTYEIKELSNKNNGYNTLKTAKGETYQVRLPDGSLVWMNAASSLTYPATLIREGLRKVKLSGEAYFEVAKDKDHPFIVESKGQQIEVVGTHFNVNAYADELVTKTTLLEGGVKVSNGHVKKTLLPGNEAVNAGNDIIMNSVDPEFAVAWKNNNFVFANERIETVMRMVERWYDVDVIYQEQMPEDRFRGSVSRFDDISKVLNILESTGLVHFTIKGRKVYVFR